MVRKQESDQGNENIVITISAHNDDYILGCGGTIAKYLQEGKRVINIIFSYGELSHPWLKEDVIREKRFAESLKAEKMLGGKDIIYLGIHEGKFLEEFPPKKQFFLRILEKYKPKRIFTHASDDPHPDHHAVWQIIESLKEELSWKPELWTFEVWNLFNLKKRKKPQLVVDITHTMKKKVAAFKVHESQKIAILLHLWWVYVRAFYLALGTSATFVEVFWKEG